MKKIVTYVEEGSLAQQYGIKAGFEVNSINKNEAFDIIDYLYDTSDEKFEICITDIDGNRETMFIENPDLYPFGLSFENATIDKPRICKNKCAFCFMDQMPKGLRKSLYFKDDDYRLSFLCGNYITLTNVSNEELDRIIQKKLSPLNISVHVTDEELRMKLMHNKDAYKIIEQLTKLKDNGIEFNVQLVLCPGINDGEYLCKSLDDMIKLLPNLNSLSCVPVGLTKFRDGLFELTPYTKEQAIEVISIIEHYREIAKEISPNSCINASDEFYLLAEMDFPKDEYYGDYVQYENGVGMARSFIDDVDMFISQNESLKLTSDTPVYLITGVLGYKSIKTSIEKINDAFGLNMNLISVDNDFFGSLVTASGLVCGCDIINKINNLGIKGDIIIPANMLKDDEDLFLDNTSLEDVINKTEQNVIIAPTYGYDFCEMLKERYMNE